MPSFYKYIKSLENYINENENNIVINEFMFNHKLSAIEKEHLKTLSYQTPYSYYDLAIDYIRSKKCLISFEKGLTR